MSKRAKKSSILKIFLLLIIFAAAIGGSIYVLKYFQKKDEPKEPEPTATIPEPEPEPEPVVPSEIDLQTTVDAWTKSHTKTGVMIYDLDNDTVAAEYKSDTKYRIESIYKLFVAYDGYKLITDGKFDANETVPIAKDYTGKNYTISLCLDHMIRFSYSPCGEYIWSKIGHGALQGAYNNLGFKNTTLDSIMSSAGDLAKLIQLIYEDEHINADLKEQLFDSMLNQTANTKDTRYNSNWRRGLPTGFSIAKVYNKVGWLGDGNGHWIYFDDAALVVFPETTDKEGNTVPERHLAVVVLTTNTNPSEIVNLGKSIEAAVKKHDNY